MGWQVAMAVGGAILGGLRARRRRREERARRRRERKIALRTQKSLLQAVPDIRQRYRQEAGFMREQFGVQQMSGLQAYGVEREGAEALIGSTNLAYSGSAERQKSLLDESMLLQQRDQFVNMQRDFTQLREAQTRELRDVQVGLLNLEAQSAQRGYTIPSMGASFMRGQNTNLGGMY